MKKWFIRAALGFFPAVLLYNATIYILTGRDLLSGDDGARWIELSVLAIPSAVVMGITWEAH